MKSPDPLVYVGHIRDCCQQLRECSALREKGTVPPAILFAAVCRNLEIIGEATRRIDTAFRQAHPDIPWREMNDLRNVIIHNYDAADPELIWNLVDRDIRPLLAAILRLLGPAP